MFVDSKKNKFNLIKFFKKLNEFKNLTAHQICHLHIWLNLKWPNVVATFFFFFFYWPW